MHLVPFYYPRGDRNLIAGFNQLCGSVGSIIGGYMASYLTDRIGSSWVGRGLVLLFSFSLTVYVVVCYV